MSAGKNLLARIDDFLKESNMPPSLFGRNAVRDPRLVSDLKQGREPSRELVGRVESYMRRWRAQRRSGLVAPRPVPVKKDRKLADEALRAAGRDGTKAVELLRIAIESIQFGKVAA